MIFRKNIKKKRATGRFKILKKIIFIIFFCLFLIGIYYLIFDFFKVKDYLLNSNIDCIDKPELKRQLSQKKYNFLFINLENLKTSLKNDNACIGDLEIIKKFPNLIEINIYPREGVLVFDNLISDINQIKNIELSKSLEASFSASRREFNPDFEVKTSSISASFLVDKNGFVFSNAPKDTKLKKITGFIKDLKLGQKIEEKVVKNSLEILLKLRDKDIFVESAKVYNNDSLLILTKDSSLKQDMKVIFSLVNDTLSQMASLQLIMEASIISTEEIDSKELVSIDLRYTRPVVRYSPKKK